jgi:hypothetical protein
MNYLISLMISSTLGFLLIDLLSFKKPIDVLQKLILSVGLGLGLSGQLGFYSLIVSGEYSPPFVGAVHAGLLSVLMARRFYLYKKNRQSLSVSWDRPTLMGLAVLSLLLLPLWREAHFFPFGGWDAWSCWNLKARFIFLGGENWKNMLDPVLWRSNNQYPFLLPLITAWGWMFYNDATVLVPMFNAIIFSFLTAAFLFASLRRSTGLWTSVAAPLVLFSIPFVNKLSISQYSDIVVAFYLLTALSALVQAKSDKHPTWAVISGMAVGLMSFTKTEGLVASVIIGALAIVYLRGTKLLPAFLMAAVISTLPTIMFKLMFSPENAAFINGLTSSGQPTSLIRLQIILMFLAVEIVSLKWNGLWILLAIGTCLSGRKAFDTIRWLVPAALFLFVACAVAFYFINTYFEITWWLKNSLNRVLYTILPAFVWWIFFSLSPQKNNPVP